VRDGHIEAAIENYKLQPNAPGGIPDAAIQYCLAKCGATWNDIAVVAIARRKPASNRFASAAACFKIPASLERRFGVGNIFVPPAPGNAGCAPGAAAWIWHQKMGKPRNPEVRSVYWGPSYSRTEIKDTLDNVKARYTLHTSSERTLEDAVQLLRAGKIIGWFHGATEFGPRALGNRSILASPWAPYVSENLNDYVKHRESFRPFGVAVREEDCARYFEGSPLCRFMNSLAAVHTEASVLPPGLQLPGGLVRLHIVQKETNRLLWELLGRFGDHEPRLF
jgi:carbamoyltransferase